MASTHVTSGELTVYQWIVFAHVGSALVFMLSHGASAAVAFRLRKERDENRIRALLDISAASYWGLSLSLLAVLASGVALGILGEWWRLGWFWTSLGLFFAITFVMTPMMAVPYNKLRVALGIDLPMGRQWRGAGRRTTGAGGRRRHLGVGLSGGGRVDRCGRHPGHPLAHDV